VKAWKLLAEAAAPDGGRLQLVERDREFVIRIDGQLLMSSRMHGSEEAMAEVGVGPATAAQPRARVLIGGLGCGYTVRATLDRLRPDATIIVAEIAKAVVDWNRGPLGPLAGHPLDDARVQVKRTDVRTLLTPEGRYHAILLDVDNGPQALSARSNHGLYQPAGLQRAHAALVPGGTLVVWSAAPDTRFADRLRAAGFEVEVRAVPIRSPHVAQSAAGSEKETAAPARPVKSPAKSKAGGRHILFVATRPAPRHAKM
jgi:spermidine synthase